jgi:hypothetical protein
VSTDVAAGRQVDMERAKSDLREHQSVCLCSAVNVASLPPQRKVSASHSGHRSIRTVA